LDFSASGDHENANASASDPPSPWRKEFTQFSRREVTHIVPDYSSPNPNTSTVMIDDRSRTVGRDFDASSAAAASDDSTDGGVVHVEVLGDLAHRDRPD
jgi:hypothetical protein